VRKTKDLTGQRFGRLVVLGPGRLAKKGKTTQRLWLCQCDCGNTTHSIAWLMKNGVKLSCGCLKADSSRSRRRESHPTWTGYNDISGAFWCRVKTGARIRKIEFDITIEEAWQLYLEQHQLCALSGQPIFFAKSTDELKAGLNTASLDRIDSNKGYVKDNIQWVHVDVNYMKQWFDQNKFIEWCEHIARHNQKRVAA